MTSNLVIFIPEEIPGLSEQFNLGTESFASITNSSFDKEDLLELQSRNPKKLTEGEPEFSKADFDYYKSKKIKQKIHSALVNRKKLIIIEARALLPSDYKEIKGDVLDTYSPYFTSLEIKNSKIKSVKEEEKLLYFVSGKEFEQFADLLTKGSLDSSKKISDPNKERMDDEFVSAVKEVVTKLIVVNTSQFLPEDFSFYSRVGRTGKYVSQYIDLPPDDTEEQKSQNEFVEDSNSLEETIESEIHESAPNNLKVFWSRLKRSLQNPEDEKEPSTVPQIENKISPKKFNFSTSLPNAKEKDVWK